MPEHVTHASRELLPVGSHHPCVLEVLEANLIGIFQFFLFAATAATKKQLSGNTRDSAIKIVSKISLGKVQSLLLIRWSQRDANRFSGGLIALGGNATDRDQDISLRIVCGSAPASDRIGNDGKAGRLAHLPFKVAVYVHYLTRSEISCLHIERIQKEHPATTKDTPIAVIQAIDRRIELVMAANGCQKKLVRLQVMLRDWANA